MTFPDETYLTDAAQDPNEPKWASDATIAEMQEVDDPYDTYPGTGKTPTVRTISGELDFIHIPETIKGLFGAEPVAQEKVAKHKLDPVRTRELGSDKWRPRTVAVNPQMSNPILTQSSRRRYAILTNYGPGLVYLAAVGNSGPAAPNTVRLPISGPAFDAPRRIDTRDDVWAIAAVGTTAVVEVIEVFDMED
jgi:hypothetical protein